MSYTCPVMTAELLNAIITILLRYLTGGLHGPVLTVEDAKPTEPDALDAVADAAEGKPIRLTLDLIVTEAELAAIREHTEEKPDDGA